MARIKAFESFTTRYEAWFEKHHAAYISELLALRAHVPLIGKGLEVGIGTGRFAVPLGIAIGVDPCREMIRVAKERGIDAIQGIAEELPFCDNSFDYILVVTTICFVDSLQKMLSEALRVLRPEGKLIIGFIDRDSAMGQLYEAHKAENVFYRDATFYSAEEVSAILSAMNFHITDWTQTLSHSLQETRDIEPAESGKGDYAFVVVSALSKKNSS
jgi:ubiquinone/menaquinone biosynthesis C-methylase UbiE